MTKKKSVPRKPRRPAQTKPASPAATDPTPAAKTKAASRSAPADETPDELLDRGEKSKRVAKREAALAAAADE